MIRTDKLHQWAPTQMQILREHLSDDGREYEPPAAAHAATDIGAEDDSSPIPGAGAFVVPAVVAFIAVCAAGLHVWARYFH